MTRASYPFDLTDAEWMMLEPLFPARRMATGRHPRREIVTPIFYYALRAGSHWQPARSAYCRRGPRVWWYF